MVGLQFFQPCNEDSCNEPNPLRYPDRRRHRRRHHGPRHRHEPGQCRRAGAVAGQQPGNARTGAGRGGRHLRAQRPSGPYRRGAGPGAASLHWQGDRLPGAEGRRSGDRSRLRKPRTQAEDLPRAGRHREADRHPRQQHLGAGYRRHRRRHRAPGAGAGPALLQPGAHHESFWRSSAARRLRKRCSRPPPNWANAWARSA